MDPCKRNLEGNQRETSIQINELEIMMKQDPVEGRQRETTDETRSSRRETNLEIMTKQDPVEGRQRETNLEIMMKQDLIEQPWKS